MFPGMGSRGITAIALYVTLILGAVAALPGVPGDGSGPDSGGSAGLMRALEQAPKIVVTWKRAQEDHGHPVSQTRGTRGLQSRHNPFRISIFTSF